MVEEITQAIDELSNLKTLKQLEKETLRAREASKHLEEKAEAEELRLEEAKIRMDRIVEDEKEHFNRTAEILRNFEKQSGNGPFFKSLLDILVNFQGKDNHSINSMKTSFLLII